MTPEKINRYEIKSELGRGGMATVYEAYDPRFERTVAVKVLPREFMHEKEFRARFTREARTIANLEHPSIVPVYDFGEENGQPFLVMRLMTGGSLSDRLAEGPLPIEEAATILQRLGSALDRAHSLGIIHRDLKPSNVLFDQFGDAYLADFGIVHVSSSTNALTASGSLVGTPTYMSPEQVYGDKKLDGRADIYALGVILFQMLTGHTPYDADTPARMMMKHVMDPIPQILTVRPDLPPACENIINKAMAKERDERYATATDLSSELTAVTKHSLNKPDIQQELTDMQSKLTEPRPAAATHSPTPAPAPPSTPGVTTTPQPATAPSTGNGRTGIPKWVYALVAVLALVCLAGVAGVAYVASNDGFAAIFADPTNTPRPDEDEEELDPDDEEATEVALAADETATAEAELPTGTPTFEPETATPTDEPEATPTPTIDALATRESAEATRDAANPPTPPPDLPDSELAALYGPFDGDIAHEEDNIIETIYADVTPQNFVMQVEMQNPYDVSVNDWDFGLIFRQSEADDELRLVVRSDGLWTLNDRTPGEDLFIQEGDVLEYLNLDPDGANLFELIANGEEGYFFLNGIFIEKLDLSSRLQEGSIALGTGFYGSDELEGEVTAYDGFGIWPLTPVFGPSSGELVHELDDLIKLEEADVDQFNFIAQTTFENPFAASENDWDVGFSFRADDAFKYWLILSSEGDWVLYDRQGSADDDVIVDEGTLATLNLGANETNSLTLIAWDTLGYAFLNGEFLAELDLSDRLESGDIEVVTAFYFDHELEGRATGYQDFTVWPLP